MMIELNSWLAGASVGNNGKTDFYMFIAATVDGIGRGVHINTNTNAEQILTLKMNL